MDDESGDDDRQVDGEVSRDMTGEADGMNQAFIRELIPEHI